MDAPDPSNSENPPAERRAPFWARVRSVVSRYRDARLIIVGYGFFAPGGAWKSIYQYYTHMTMTGEKVMLIHRPMRHSVRQLLMAFFVGRRVLFNGLDCFFHWGAILFCLLRSDVTVYLHETRFIFDNFRRGHPRRYRLVRRIIERNRICCVSHQQEAFLRSEFGARRTHVVYENISPTSPDEIEALRTNIVMVGTVDERKGASLFSRVADLARATNLPWRFYWIGPISNSQDLYLSPNVSWLGAKPDVFPFLSRADLFFLSSVDDPFPLACLEALSLYRRCVVYRATGLAEVLEGIRGCAVFEKYDAETAFETIKNALGEELDRDRVRAVNESVSSVKGFAQRMEIVLRACDRSQGREPLPAASSQQSLVPDTPR